MKKILFAALLSFGCMTASAQGKTETVEDFNSHWYVQGHFGGQYTTGESKFTNLLSPTAQLGVGYQFTPVWGLRFDVNGWQSRGASDFRLVGNTYKWKWNYVAPKLNATFDLLSAIKGYNPKQVFSLGVFAGIGANVGFNNDEAAIVRTNVINDMFFDPSSEKAVYMTYLWDGTKVRFMGNVGLDLDFKVSKRVKLGLEFAYNFTTDHYNSKNAPGKCDHYYNAMAGVRVDLGKTSKTKTVEVPVQIQTVERIVERRVEVPVHDTIYIEKKEPSPEQIRRDIFFLIRGSEISNEEMRKIDEVVAYMQKYPNSTVTVTGYADKGTGNPQLNIGYSQKRANVVAETFKKRGISANRIIVDAKGDTEQPYAENGKNRVTICVAK